jgi:hypothetical protein
MAKNPVFKEKSSSLRGSCTLKTKKIPRMIITKLNAPTPYNSHFCDVLIILLLTPESSTHILCPNPTSIQAQTEIIQ